MAKTRRREPGQTKVASTRRSDTGVISSPEVSGHTTPKKLSARSYLLMNGIFIAFCVLQLLFIRMTLNEDKGLYFFFGLLIVGFAVVSAYDYIYDRVASTAEED